MSTDCGLRIADCGLRIADCGLRIADCDLRIGDCRLSISDLGFRTVDWLIDRSRTDRYAAKSAIRNP